MFIKSKVKLLSIAMMIIGAIASIYFYLNKIETVNECGSACKGPGACIDVCVRTVTTETNPYLWVALPFLVIGIILFIYSKKHKLS
jgi:hypothetical protein